MSNAQPKPAGSERGGALASDPKGAVEGDKGSRASWFLGWVIGPGLVVLGILTAGAYVGANHPESWVTRLTEWLVALF